MSKGQILSVLGSKGGVAVIVGILSGVSGGAAGYFIAKKRLEARYISVSNREIATARKFYRDKLRERQATTDMVIEEIRSHAGVEGVADALLAYSGEELPVQAEHKPETPAPDFDVKADGTILRNRREGTNNRVPYDQFSVEKPTLQEVAGALNVFTDHAVQDPEIDEMEAEKAARDEHYPYVITADEFLENEPGHDQLNLTFYEEDGILADDQEIPVQDLILVVGGADNLHFGKWSGDENIVYIRNHRLTSDFEVSKTPGSYASIVGFRHSDEPRRKQRPRRMRSDDD